MWDLTNICPRLSVILRKMSEVLASSAYSSLGAICVQSGLVLIKLLMCSSNGLSSPKSSLIRSFKRSSDSFKYEL